MPDKKKHDECMSCFEDFTDKSNTLFQDFEIKSNAVMQNIIEKTDHLFTHLKEETNQFIENREKKIDEFYDKQEKRYDKLEKRMMDAVKYTLGVVLFIISVYGAVIGFLFVEVDKKAECVEVLSLEDAYTLRIIGDKYYDQRYVIKSGEQVDKSTYEWHMDAIFEKLSRGQKLKPVPKKPENK